MGGGRQWRPGIRSFLKLGSEKKTPTDTREGGGGLSMNLGKVKKNFENRFPVKGDIGKGV